MNYFETIEALRRLDEIEERYDELRADDIIETDDVDEILDRILAYRRTECEHR